MDVLESSVAVLGRPYAITRSRLGAITKVYKEQYICDLPALKELLHSIGEKLVGLQDVKGTPTFSFLISFSDQTHHDGTAGHLQGLTTIAIGKQTQRIVMRWVLKHQIDTIDNELSITIRISNPINPLVFLQAALSKSPNEIDNMEFEMGSTCVTVDGAGHSYCTAPDFLDTVIAIYWTRPPGCLVGRSSLLSQRGALDFLAHPGISPMA